MNGALAAKIHLGWRSKAVPRVLRTPDWGRVNHLNTFGGGVFIKSSCVHLGLLAVPQTGFLGGECLRFGCTGSFNPVSCQRQIDGFSVPFYRPGKEASGTPSGQSWDSDPCLWIPSLVLYPAYFTFAFQPQFPFASPHERCVCSECCACAGFMAVSELGEITLWL